MNLTEERGSRSNNLTGLSIILDRKMGISPEQMAQMVASYGSLAVFIGMFLKEVLIVLPSSVIAMGGGFLLVDATASTAVVKQLVIRVSLPAAVGMTLGSLAIFTVCKKEGHPLIEKYGPYLHIPEEKVDHLEDYFGHEKEKYYLGALRAAPLFPLTTVSAAAGLFEMDTRTYGFWTFIGIIPRIMIYASIGWFVGQKYLLIASKVSKYSTYVTFLLIVGIASYFLYEHVHEFHRSIL